ncbi:helix-turn-helix transcriptional regulator [Microvirga sp. STR05]|uniref:Helix-turn-helix transcriptional regulator n=1 Tax=Hymenobacter duratus TaxID=2771356 RepID=A0ABR8JJH0_9BACT|nr:helix-turn-helix transcriptional regulator [Hymenobacter duratus]MBD2716985.1 helix-turn-helix transcriptional regulator [Hymenobacter duratus]MBR7951901.1 helix-turn-helix transcriptional regulator [Microvirga sp. STR05]
MPRQSIPSTTLLAQVRKYFGLEQRELAGLLGVTAAQVGHIEAGRRTLTSKVLLRLNPLAALLPPEAPAPLSETELAATVAPPAAGPLEARLDYCRHHAGRLRRQLRTYTTRANYAHRWQQALPTLLAAIPEADFTNLPPASDLEALHAWNAARTTRARLHQLATELTPAETAEWHLLRLRAEALETEAAALAELLAVAAG